jgi:hypothetical protein
MIMCSSKILLGRVGSITRMSAHVQILRRLLAVDDIIIQCDCLRKPKTGQVQFLNSCHHTQLTSLHLVGATAMPPPSMAPSRGREDF